MKKLFLLLLAICIISCRSDLIHKSDFVIGDYTKGDEGLQLRLNSDSTFYIEFFERPLPGVNWNGTWTISSDHRVVLHMDMTNVTPLTYFSSNDCFISRKWSAEIIDRDILKVIINDSVDGPVLRRGRIYSCLNESEIYNYAHRGSSSIAK